ncbi:MAG: fasciclin domain-containing protein [Bacteroidaceae bacterium]|nr:fasciclin domain-containing protein [Bacteroidaceae bacterium]
MNHKKMLRKVRTLVLASIAAVSAMTFIACDDEIDQSSRYTFKGELISTYLENNPEQFSNFTAILRQAKIGKNVETSGSVLKTLSTYGSYTCFAPTNEAVEAYLQEQYEKWEQGERTGIDSPYLEDLSDSMALEIAKNHIIERGYKTTDINEGAFPMNTMNRRFTTVEFITNEQGRVYPFLNNSARIIEQDLEKENGYVQVVDAVLNPSNKLLHELIGSQEGFSLFNEAIMATKLDTLLAKYHLDPNYDGNIDAKDLGYELDSEKGSACPYPKELKQRYTVLIEPNELFHSKGINNLDDLVAFAEKWYGTAAKGDYTNPENALYKFIAYHIIDRQLLYSSSTGPGGFIMENYENAEFSSKLNLNQNFDSYEYYETMLPYTMIKVTKPYTNDQLKKEIVINYAQDGGTRIINSEMQEHINVIVERSGTTKKKYPSLADFDQNALNGIIHTIDRIIVYNEDEIAGNIFNERIRMDLSAVFPELTNNSVRWDLSSSSCLVTFLPAGYCKGFEVLNENCEVYYYRPHATLLGSWANYQGDEFIVEGKYDFRYRLPHVPEGVYEIRFGYPKGYYRGVCQFYVDGKIAGIPVDLRWNDATTILIGWSSDEELGDQETIKEYDKAMRNRGYMKGPASIVLEDKEFGTMRDSEQALRKIVGTYRLNKGDHWMRFKDVSDGGTGVNTQFDQDYIELVPTGVINNPLKPEDIY